MKMKKIICAILATAMLLLTACGSVEANETANETTKETTATVTYAEMEEMFYDVTEDEYEHEEEYDYEDDYEYEVVEEEEEDVVDDERQTYILNTSSKKIHYTWCHSAKRMKDSNTRYVTDTVDNLIEQGYSPCGNCDPY